MTSDEILFQDLGSDASLFVKRTISLMDDRTKQNITTVLTAGGTVDARVSFRLDGSMQFAFDVVGADGVRHELWRAPL